MILRVGSRGDTHPGRSRALTPPAYIALSDPWPSAPTTGPKTRGSDLQRVLW